VLQRRASAPGTQLKFKQQQQQQQGGRGQRAKGSAPAKLQKMRNTGGIPHPSNFTTAPPATRHQGKW